MTYVLKLKSYWPSEITELITDTVWEVKWERERESEGIERGREKKEIFRWRLFSQNLELYGLNTKVHCSQQYVWLHTHTHTHSLPLSLLCTHTLNTSLSLLVLPHTLIFHVPFTCSKMVKDYFQIFCLQYATEHRWRGWGGENIRSPVCQLCFPWWCCCCYILFHCEARVGHNKRAALTFFSGFSKTIKTFLDDESVR